MKKIINVLMIICLMSLCGCSSDTKTKEIVVENVEQASTLNPIFYYDQLNDNEKVYYDLLLEASKVFNTSISGDFNFDIDEFQNALYAFTYDYPQYYWWRSGLKTSVSNNTFNSYCDENENVEENYNKIIAIKDTILTECKDDNNYKYIKNIHDYLVNNISYNVDDVNGHNISGSLIDKKAVCDGYSLAYKYLLNEAGFNCIGADGQAIENNEIIEHAWNYVELNNSWYLVDCTWDDAVYEGENEGKLIYDYFLLSDEMFYLDHFQTKGFAYPKCNDDSLFYLNMSGTYIKEYDKNSIFSLIKEWINNGSEDIYIKFMNFENGVDAYKWLLEQQGFVDIYQESNKNYDITFGGEYNNNSHVLHIYYRKAS